MYLKELIELLSKVENKKNKLKLGFSNPHSYRGYYDRLAFEPTENVTVAQMLKDAKSALGSTYQGWKGGEFTMKEYTEVYLAEHGHCGEEIGPMLLNYMLKDEI